MIRSSASLRSEHHVDDHQSSRPDRIHRRREWQLPCLGEVDDVGRRVVAHGHGAGLVAAGAVLLVRTIIGISATRVVQLMAEKFTRVTFPRRSAVVLVVPSSRRNFVSGALDDEDCSQNAAATPSTRMKAKALKAFFICCLLEQHWMQDSVRHRCRRPRGSCTPRPGRSFLFFRALSAPPKVTGIDPAQVGQLTIGTMISGIAMAAQYVAPFICLLATVVSFARRRRREELVASAGGATGLNSGAGSIVGISWREFELLVGEAFRLQNYQVAEIGGGGPDGGVDLRLRRGNETFLVQCKQWRATRVGVDVVRQLYGVMAAEGSTGGFVVTSGQFTPDALAFATGRNIKLVDGQRLNGLLQQARASRGAAAPAVASVRPSP